MSPLARRVGLVAIVVLGVQLVAAVIVQAAVMRSLRGELVRGLTRSMETSGALRECADRPGPWEHPDGWWTVWPLTDAGEPVGEGAPFAAVSVPVEGATEAWSKGGQAGLVYGSSSPGCGGLLVTERASLPLIESQSSRVALLVGLRVLLLVLAAIALVALTALPLIRRIRALSRSMQNVVDANFEGAIADGADDEIGDVARAFDAAAASARERLERLEHRDAILRRAMADLAHDLRTPLATLTVSASGLPPSSAAHTIRAELSFLEGMTRNFEALLATEDEGDPEVVVLDHLLERVQHRFALPAKDRGIVLDVGLPDETLHVWAESVALERSYSNLVQNAVRFAEGHVALLLFRAGEEVRLEVRDDGPGFGDLLGRAAERGVRGEGSVAEGAGLGLAIAEHAARRFGGRLELTTGDDGETVVAIVLPWVDATGTARAR